VSSAVLAALEHAREQTLAAGSARIELAFESIRRTNAGSEGRQRVIGPVLDAAGSGARRVFGAIGRDFRQRVAEGLLDLAQRRYLLDYGYYALLYTDGTEWDGRSGRPIATLPPNTDPVPTPLWLVDLLAGVVAVSDCGAEDVRGVRCDHLSARADLSRAPGTIQVLRTIPPPRSSEELQALPLDVWLDGSHIRRVRFTSEVGRKQRRETLELWDFGVPLDDLDWTRLPTFRSPDEAAQQS
jgi:hypothetical protein